MSAPAALCRDCLHKTAAGRARCSACGSPRLLAHPERDALAIAHIDCDAFYAAVEKRDDPRLHDKPLIIGGGKRGVVATCCYIARASRRALGNADVQGAGALSAGRRHPPRHGEICRRRARQSAP